MSRLTLLSVALLTALLVGCTQTVPASPVNGTAESAASEAGTVDCEYPVSGTAAREVAPPSGTGVSATGTATWVLTLNDTPITLTLDRQAAPCTVHSFESLAQQGYFDGTDCHRLTTAGIFVLQCGDPTGSGRGGPGYAYADELAAIAGYPAGTLAMANAGPDTNGSQFFIVYADTQLPASYTVFGSTDAAGVAAITAIAAGGTDGSYGTSADGVPNQPARITSVAAG